tara:strand:- start:274 stop:1032 length:759 start_codon:yes stop_codon:yes gene_type:complete
MKTIGILLIVVGLACFAFIFTGLYAWTAPMPAEPTIESLTKIATGRLFLMYGLGGASIVGGAFMLVLGIKKSRQRKRDGIKTDIRKPIAVTLVGVMLLAGVVFAGVKFMTRWNPDIAWAAKVIGESEELQILLARYQEVNGEYPESLDDIEEDYTKPTDFLSRNADPAGESRWFYERIGPNDYQLEATAYSWVSYHDSLVYRHSGSFTEPWFSNPDAPDSREFGKWRYIEGFSQHGEMYYFDANGQFHKGDR